MGLEVGSFVQDLVVTNPTSADPVSQGDDHLRLIKDVLDATFPNASKAFYFPGVSASKVFADTPVTVAVTDEGDLFIANATDGAITFNLPAAATAGNGFEVGFKKTDSSANAVTLDGSGAETIDGSATIAISVQNQTVWIRSNGTSWYIVQRNDPSYLSTSVAATTYEPLGAMTGIRTATTDDTLVLTDAGKTVEMNAATAKEFTIPPNSSVAFATNTYINLVRYGAGALTVQGGTGVTLNGVSTGTITIADQFGGATIYKRGTNEWVAPNYTAS